MWALTLAGIAAFLAIGSWGASSSSPAQALAPPSVSAAQVPAAVEDATDALTWEDTCAAALCGLAALCGAAAALGLRLTRAPRVRPEPRGRRVRRRAIVSRLAPVARPTPLTLGVLRI